MLLLQRLLLARALLRLRLCLKGIFAAQHTDRGARLAHQMKFVRIMGLCVVILLVMRQLNIHELSRGLPMKNVAKLVLFIMLFSSVSAYASTTTATAAKTTPPPPPQVCSAGSLPLRACSTQSCPSVSGGPQWYPVVKGNRCYCCYQQQSAR